MISVKWHVDDVLNRINRMIDLSGDLRPVFLKIRGESLNTDQMTIIGGITSQFVSRGSYFGSQWKELSPAYGEWKAHKYPGKTTLRATDKMFSAAAVQNSPGNVEVLDYNRIVWGVSDTEIPYAKFHQEGTKKMPQRQFIGYTDEQGVQWQQMIAGYLLDTGQS